MKTLTTIAASLLMLMLSAGSKAEVSVPVQINPSKGTLVKAEMVQGELMPVVDLPTINVTASKPGHYVLKCIVRNGQVYGEVYLQEVEITANKPTGVKFSVQNVNGEPIAIVNLPVIEILSEMNINGLEKATISEDDQVISIVDLPEITITGTAINPVAEARSVVFDISGIENEFEWMTVEPFVISLQNSALTAISQSFGRQQIALANCIIPAPGKLACELISTVKK
jgi:hypothetical protein